MAKEPPQPGSLKNIFCWVAQIIPAAVLLQTLFFKFTGAEESVYIFSILGMEPWGRIGSGAVELFAAILLLLPAYAWRGAIIGLASMSSAIFLHLTTLGIEVMGDGGLLFFLAIVVWICCAAVLYFKLEEVKAFFDKFRGQRNR